MIEVPRMQPSVDLPVDLESGDSSFRAYSSIAHCRTGAPNVCENRPYYTNALRPVEGSSERGGEFLLENASDIAASTSSITCLHSVAAGKP